MRKLQRHFLSLLTMLAGSAGVLGVVYVMNEASSPPPKPDKEAAASFNVERKPPKPKPVKRKPKPKSKSKLKPKLKPKSKPDPRRGGRPEGVEERGGPRGPEPTRYGDWEKGGRCSDF